MMKNQKLLERYYPPEMRDNDGVFLEMIEKCIRPEMRILDAGAGAGESFRYDLKGRVAEVVGLDLDPRVLENPQLDRGVLGDARHMDFPDASFDLVFCRYVLEHVQEPDAFAASIARNLKPNGRFLFLTPSKWHYVSFVARLTPDAFHKWYNERLRGRSADDTFPTFYKLNSARELGRVLGGAGFEEEALLRREVSPNYLLWNRPLFFLGMLYEMLLNRYAWLAPLRANILGCYVKREKAV